MFFQNFFFIKSSYFKEIKTKFTKFRPQVIGCCCNIIGLSKKNCFLIHGQSWFSPLQITNPPTSQTHQVYFYYCSCYPSPLETMFVSRKKKLPQWKKSLLSLGFCNNKQLKHTTKGNQSIHVHVAINCGSEIQLSLVTHAL